MINFAPSARAMTLALRMVKPGGTAVMVALNPKEITLSLQDIVLKGLTIIGSIVGTRADMNAAMDLAARGFVIAHSHICECKVLIMSYQIYAKMLMKAESYSRVHQIV